MFLIIPYTKETFTELKFNSDNFHVRSFHGTADIYLADN
jgi:hypothetical protein